MLFNSLEYLIFLPLSFLLYWFVFNKNRNIQNFFLFGISYIFYACWDWRFVLLILFSSIVDFYVGQKIFEEKQKTRKKRWLFVSLFSNLGLLIVFKYFNFFIDSFVDLANLIGIQANYYSLKIILPVGISFYTFQTLSYTIDIYREKLKPTKDTIGFFAFVCFFPQLVAGPIERAQDLLPQFLKDRKFDYAFAVDGMRQMLWGFFKKIVIADNCAFYVNEVFGSNELYSTPTLIVGGILFAIQVYADFSGYTDIAIGSAKLFGFQLSPNFKTPYFSTHWGEFWKRWHISLSSWILDYVYNPLAINKRHWGINGIVYALVVTFTLNGLWHGANWTFVVFGFLLGIFIGLEFLLKKRRNNLKKKLGKNTHNLLGWFTVMILWVFVCILFRSQSMGHFFDYISGIINFDFSLTNKAPATSVVIVISLTFIIEWFQRKKNHPLSIESFPIVSRWAVYQIILICILTLGTFNNDAFIYFQF